MRQIKFRGKSHNGEWVYGLNLPFVLDILNTMTKEAKEIEKMNSRIKRNKTSCEQCLASVNN